MANRPQVLGKIAPDLSHLTRDDIVAVINANNEAQITYTRGTYEFLLGSIDKIRTFSADDIDKVSKIFSSLTAYNGGCGCSAGCC